MQAMSDDKLRRLRQCWREGETFTPRVVGDLLDEIDRLRTTVAKLPTYADTGEPFVPGRDEAWGIVGKGAYRVHRARWINDKFGWDYDVYYGVPVGSRDDDGLRNARPAYSTEAAALASKEQPHDE